MSELTTFVAQQCALQGKQKMRRGERCNSQKEAASDHQCKAATPWSSHSSFSSLPTASIARIWSAIGLAAARARKTPDVSLFASAFFQ